MYANNPDTNVFSIPGSWGLITKPHPAGNRSGSAQQISARTQQFNPVFYKILPALTIPTKSLTHVVFYKYSLAF